MAVHKFSMDYQYLGSISKEEAIAHLYTGRAMMLIPTEEVWRSPSTTMIVPEAIRMVVGSTARAWVVRCTRESVYKRDRHTCQYCGRRGKRMTLDHVVPQAYFRNGTAAKRFPGVDLKSFENLVTSCEPCNNRKADRTPDEAGMKLLAKPKRPTPTDLVDIHALYAKIAGGS